MGFFFWGIVAGGKEAASAPSKRHFWMVYNSTIYQCSKYYIPAGSLYKCQMTNTCWALQWKYYYNSSSSSTRSSLLFTLAFLNLSTSIHKYVFHLLADDQNLLR